MMPKLPKHEENIFSRDTASDWHLTSVFPVRSAGFPYEWVEQLQCHITAQLTDTIVVSTEQLQRLGREIRSQLAVARLHATDSAQIHHTRSIEHCVRKLKVISQADRNACSHVSLCVAIDEWNKQVTERTQLIMQGRAIWDVELSRTEEVLNIYVQDERFIEAVFLSSPSMERALQRYLHKQLKLGEHHYTQLKLVRYLQRLCAKNETTSFFGPIANGILQTIDPSMTVLGEVGERPTERRTFFAHWAAKAIADTWVDEPAFTLEQRVGRTTRIAYSEVSGLLSPIERHIFTLADGKRSLRALAEILDKTPQQVVEQVSVLVTKGLLEIGFPLDSYALDGLDDLYDLFKGMRLDNKECEQKWNDVLVTLLQMRDLFGNALLSERIRLLQQAETLFTNVVKVPSQRGAGEHYADRLLFYEECAAPFSITIGGHLARELPRALAPSLDIVADPAVKMRSQQREKAEAEFQRWKTTDHILHLQSLDILDTPYVGPNIWDSYIAKRMKQETRVLSLRASDVEPLILEKGRGLFVAPDVMLAAANVEAIERGDYRIILGEAQHVLPMSSLPLMIFYPDEASAKKEVAEAIQGIIGSSRPAIFSLERKTKGLDIVPFVGMTVIHPLWLHPVSIGHSVAIGDLIAHPTAVGEWELRVEGHEGSLVILPHYEDQGNPELPRALVPFALPAVDKQPVILGVHTPRIEVNNVVWQRERWDLSTADAFPQGDCRSFDNYLKIWQWKRRLGLPNQVFAQVPSEPKPWLVDFLSPLSCAVFLQMIQTASALTLTEMLPNPDELWLQGKEGRYTCEFRFTAFRSA